MPKGEKKKGYKYWVFYERKNSSMYAYTDDKMLADLFRLMRRKDLFYEKKLRVTKEDLKILHDKYAINRLELYKKFHIDEKEIHFPITQLEKLEIEHRANQAIIDLSLIVADIPLHLFKPKVRTCLEKLGWGLLYDNYHNLTFDPIDKYIKPDLLKTFFFMYGDTLKEVNYRK